MKHLCQASGCGAMAGFDKLMCPAHWRMVPLPLQRRITHHWRRLQSAQFPADKIEPQRMHRAAIEEAIRAVMREERP